MATYEKRNIGGSSYTVPTGTRSDWKPGQAYSNTPSTPTTTTTTTAKPTTETTSSSSSKNSTYKSPTAGKIDTSGLTGYALNYANAINGGANDTQAHQYSTYTGGGSGISQNDMTQWTSNPGLSYSGGYTNGQADNPYTQWAAQQEQLMQNLPIQKQQFDYQDMLDDIMSRMPALPATQPALSYSEAQQQAQNFYNPMYGDLMKQSLQAVDQNNIKRGFFGQLPGAALERSTAADIESKKAQAIGQFANQLVGQSQQNALGLQQVAQQQYQAQANALLNALNAAVSYDSGKQGNLINLYNAYINQQRADQERERDQLSVLPWLTWGGAM